MKFFVGSLGEAPKCVEKQQSVWTVALVLFGGAHALRDPFLLTLEESWRADTGTPEPAPPVTTRCLMSAAASSPGGGLATEDLAGEFFDQQGGGGFKPTRRGGGGQAEPRSK